MQLGAADGMQGNPAAANVKLGLRALAVVMIPLTASFPQVRISSPPPLNVPSFPTIPPSHNCPQGVFVYWITSNLFSFCQTLAFKNQALRAACGIPDTRPSPPLPAASLLEHRPAKQLRPPVTAAPAASAAALISGSVHAASAEGAKKGGVVMSGERVLLEHRPAKGARAGKHKGG